MSSFNNATMCPLLYLDPAYAAISFEIKGLDFFKGTDLDIFAMDDVNFTDYLIKPEPTELVYNLFAAKFKYVSEVDNSFPSLLKVVPDNPKEYEEWVARLEKPTLDTRNIPSVLEKHTGASTATPITSAVEYTTHTPILLDEYHTHHHNCALVDDIIYC